MFVVVQTLKFSVSAVLQVRQKNLLDLVTVAVAQAWSTHPCGQMKYPINGKLDQDLALFRVSIYFICMKGVGQAAPFLGLANLQLRRLFQVQAKYISSHLHLTILLLLYSQLASSVGVVFWHLLPLKCLSQI
jgi:hypothetical protein